MQVLSSEMGRRGFLASLAGAAAMNAAPPSGLRLGLDAYSIRAMNWKALQLVDYAAAQKLDVLQFSNLTTFESLDADYLRKVKDRADAAGIELELGLGSICPTAVSWNKRYGTPQEYLATACRVSRALGATRIKAYLGNSADRSTELPLQRHIEETVKVLKSVRSVAVDHGVKIAMENHSGDLQSRELRDLIEEAGREWVGCNFDSGNPVMTLEDPHEALEILGPYTLTTHLRDSVVFEHPRGAAWQWVAMGDGVVEWPRFVERFKALCPNAPFQLENITGRPPRVVPYFEKDFWKPFPKVLASDFTHFTALARRGHPLMQPMVVTEGQGPAPQEYKDALVRQQLVDVEKGLEFSRTALGIGVNCRKGGRQAA